MKDSEFAQLFQFSGHWVHYDLAGWWRAAGQALSESYPSAARRAYDWSSFYFEAYNRAWSASSASRWDSDGLTEMSEVNQLRDALAPVTEEAPLPAWVDHLLGGRWRQAVAGFEQPVAPFDALVPLLDACRAAVG